MGQDWSGQSFGCYGGKARYNNPRYVVHTETLGSFDVGRGEASGRSCQEPTISMEGSNANLSSQGTKTDVFQVLCCASSIGSKETRVRA